MAVDVGIAMPLRNYREFATDLTPCEQNAFDLHKAFLVAKADAYALRSARAFEDAAKFARQATRGLFLLHGA
ncbi:MAG: hypothetical protein K6E40_15845, partial [Desulfovibrio sp.]|nr:hypothetical protein [Desulfovibrio sp.]